LFCTYQTRTTEGSDGRIKATGGKKRIMRTERSAAWDAKNRYGLPEELPMEIAALAPIFAAPAKRLGWRERVAAASTVAELGRISDDADAAESAGKLSPEQRAQLDDMIAARDEALHPAEVGA
jgi:hypothetical protein